jgi:hypothetical protein
MQNSKKKKDLSPSKRKSNQRKNEELGIGPCPALRSEEE